MFKTWLRSILALVIVVVLSISVVACGDSEDDGDAPSPDTAIPPSQTSITPFQFIVVVAIYMIETSIILAIFVNGIENGEDEIGRNDSIANSLMIGFVVFVIVLFITLMIFDPLIDVVIT